MNINIIKKESLSFLRNEEKNKYDLVYVDPPFNTKKERKNKTFSYHDTFSNYREFIYPFMEETYRVLKETGSFFIHLDYREVHYARVWLDEIFGEESFLNEIIWAYDYGGRPKNYWPRKHDSILWYVVDPNNYTFNYEQIDRIPYMSPKLVGEEKAKKGKTPTDCWWNTIVPTNSFEKTGYPTQKPLSIIERIVKVHSNENDLLLDYFAGSGTFGEAAVKHNRKVVLVDQNPQAISIINKRLSQWNFEKF